MNDAPADLYLGRVIHRRLFPASYSFSYRVFSLLLDIDRISTVAAHIPIFSHNRLNLVSFHDRDHGPRDGSNLRVWIERKLAEFGIDLEGGPVRLLCFPRVLGYVFNPLSIWYCQHATGQLRAVMCEVHNTFGESHSYLLHEAGQPLPWPVRKGREKNFHVSPFISMEAYYQFRLSAPSASLKVAIKEFQDGELMLVAAQVGSREALTTRSLLRAVARMPLMTIKVITVIHWQALRIWLKGAPLFRKPPPPSEEVS